MSSDMGCAKIALEEIAMRYPPEQGMLALGALVTLALAPRRAGRQAS